MPIEKRLSVYLALAALLAVAVHGAKIVVSFPAYNVVLKEAFPQAEVILLTRGAADPHEYQLTPQDLEFLRSLGPSDVIVNSMHAPFELKIAEMVKRGEIKAKMIDLTKLYMFLNFDGKEVRLEEDHHHEHDHHHGGEGHSHEKEDHRHTHGHHHGDEGHGHGEHGGVNMHEHGLYPPNVVKLIRAVSEATGLSPDQRFLQRLEELNKTYAGKFSGRAVAITPAAQYVLYWLGYRDIVVLAKGGGVPPAPQDLEKAIQYVKEGAPALAAYVRGERPRIVDQFIQKVEEAGVSNPKIVAESFANSYIDTLARVVEKIAAQPTAAQTSVAGGTTTQPQSPQQAVAPTSAGQWDGALTWTLAAVVAVVIVGVGIWALRRRR